MLDPTHFHFKPKEHWELAEQNGWIDFERGVKLAKSRFSVFMGMGAKLERALINYMLDFNTARGFSEVGTPAIANAQTLFGTGQLPKFEEDLFKISDFKDEENGKGHALYLIPTAEATLTNLYSDEILKEDVPTPEGQKPETKPDAPVINWGQIGDLPVTGVDVAVFVAVSAGLAGLGFTVRKITKGTKDDDEE